MSAEVSKPEYASSVDVWVVSVQETWTKVLMDDSSIIDEFI